MAQETVPFKDSLFTPAMVADFAGAIREVHPSFDVAGFTARVFDARWATLELKERMRHITAALHDCLPGEYPVALEILKRADPARLHGFVAIVPADFVAAYGLGDLDRAIPALEHFTQRLSAEFAVRPFIIRYPERMMAQMVAWADHPSAEVRRLASEGCRPRLPWGVALPALKRDPTPILPILEKLKNDPSEPVRKSVANNLNDIAKDNPGVVLDVLRRWQQTDASPEVRWITQHALRSLIKAGHPDALALLGFGAAPEIAVRRVRVEPTHIPMGGAVTFSFEVESLAEEPQDLIIDYVVHLARARGKTSAKVFKLSKRTIQPGEVIRITRRHSFQAVTTRRYYPGRHALQPKINGQLFECVEFEVGDQDEPCRVSLIYPI